jgi:serine/threonine protein kinase
VDFKLSSKFGDLLVDKSSIELGKLLGEGSFGKVFKATLGGSHMVAFKQFNSAVVQVAKKELYHEVLAFSKVKPHPNIIKVLGIVCDEASASDFFGGVGLIMELATNGTLFDLVQNNPDTSLHVRLQLTQDVCNGLAAIHKVFLVHSDIKSMNVLLCDAGDGQLVGKVTNRHPAKYMYLSFSPLPFLPDLK